MYEKNIIWFASAWDLESLKFLDKYNLKYNKIASAMIVDKKFVEEVANRGQYTFISTGMSTEEDISFAVNMFKKKGTDFELMHCVSTYPTPEKDINLKTIFSLKEKYKCNIGYSGHENGVAVSLGAAMMGITSLERHVTLDRSMYGSDQSASLEYSGMKSLIESINKIQLSIGENKLGYVNDDEKKIAKKLRSHIKN